MPQTQLPEAQINASAWNALDVLKANCGKVLRIGPERILKHNYPNYRPEDVLVESLELELKPAAQPDRFLTRIEGQCAIPGNSNIPETLWDHVSGTLAVIFITQSAKAVNCELFAPVYPGAALYQMSGTFKRAAPLRGLSMKVAGEAFFRGEVPWSQFHWEFFSEGHAEPFARFETVGCAMKRTYEELEKKRAAQQQQQGHR